VYKTPLEDLYEDGFAVDPDDVSAGSFGIQFGGRETRDTYALLAGGMLSTSSAYGQVRTAELGEGLSRLSG